jgi:hypothetical protein|tara:strand:- start:22275 stop:22910 length:636 start_codon:yes stop_codon:yes gene_type:complete
MGKMSELDMYQSDIESLQDQAMLNTSDDVLINKHQQVSETPTPSDVVKSRNGFDYVDEGYMRWRLNQNYPIWSWEVIKYETLGDKAIVVHGRLKVMDEGVPRSFDSVAAHRIAVSRNGSGYVDLGNDLKAANSDAFKVAVNRLCNVADDVYRKQYVDKSLNKEQSDYLYLCMSQMDTGEAKKVEAAIVSGKINKDNYDKVIDKLKKGVKDE